MSGLATANSGCPALTGCPSSMNTLVTRPESGEPTLEAKASSTLKRAGYGSLQRSVGASTVPSLSTFHCGALLLSVMPLDATFMPAASLASGGGLRWNEMAAKMAKPLATMAMPKLVKRLGALGRAGPPLGAVERILAAPAGC